MQIFGTDINTNAPVPLKAEDGVLLSSNGQGTKNKELWLAGSKNAFIAVAASGVQEIGSLYAADFDWSQTILQVFVTGTGTAKLAVSGSYNNDSDTFSLGDRLTGMVVGTGTYNLKFTDANLIWFPFLHFTITETGGANGINVRVRVFGPVKNGSRIKKSSNYDIGTDIRKAFNLLPQVSSGAFGTGGCRLWDTTTGWAFTQTNGTVVVNDDTLVCTTTASAARAFASRNVDFTSGRYYCLSVELAAAAVTSPNAIITNLSFTTAGAWGDTNFSFTLATIAASVGKRFGIIFKANSTAAHNIRIGIGVAAGQTISSGSMSLSFKNPMVHEIAFADSVVPRAIDSGSTAASLFAPSPFFGPAEYCPANDIGAFAYEARHTLSNVTNGEVIESVGNSITPHSYSVGGVAGDSWANEETDFPGYLRLFLPECAVSYRGFGGGKYNNSTDVPAMVDEIIARRELHPSAVKMKWIMLSPPNNDILTYGLITFNPVPRLMGQYIEQVKKILNASAIPILMTQAPLGGFASYDEAKGHQAYIQQFNAAVKLYASENNYPIIDVNSIVRDPANYNNILGAYTSDGLHLNALGGRILASRCVPIIRNIGL